MPSVTKGGQRGLKASDASTLLGLTRGYRWSAFSLKQQDPESQELIQLLEKNWTSRNRKSSLRTSQTCGLIWARCTGDSTCAIRFYTVVAKPHMLLEVWRFFDFIQDSGVLFWGCCFFSSSCQMFSFSSAQSRPQGLVQWSLLVWRERRCGRWDTKSLTRDTDLHPATAQIRPWGPRKKQNNWSSSC